MKKLFIIGLIATFLSSCAVSRFAASDLSKPVVLGIERPELYLPLLEGKRVGLLSNSTAVSGKDEKHSVDILIEHGVNVTAIFSPEHGFRDFADAGEHVGDMIDKETGIYIQSLYSIGKADVPNMIDSVDVIVIDIQDVGLRYYTYYISMMKMMDRAIEKGKGFVVMDRPNPNGSYVDGPILDMKKHKSGVGAAPIPVVHGLTLGELATMVNEEGWLKDGKKLDDLHIIECANYDHQRRWAINRRPSPNLRTLHSVYLYPSICYFEGTTVSLGRGTELSFAVYGHPSFEGKCRFQFTPMPIDGAKKPRYQGQTCYGRDLRLLDDEEIIKKGVDLSYVIDAYNLMGCPGDSFFTAMFEKLIGRDYVRKMIIEGKSAEEIKATWKDEVEEFKKLRRKYLRYAE